MGKKFEKFMKKVHRFIGWLFEDVPDRAGWSLYLIIAVISFAIFWFFGFLTLLKVYAVILWIFAIGMILISIADRAKRGRGVLPKIFKKKTVSSKSFDTADGEEIDEQQPTTNEQQPTTNDQQPTTGNKKRTTDSKKSEVSQQEQPKTKDHRGGGAPPAGGGESLKSKKGGPPSNLPGAGEEPIY